MVEVKFLNKLKSTYTLVNKETGEIYKDRNYSHPPRIFASPKRLFRKVMYDKQPELSHSDLGKWHLLIKYLEQNTNRLVMQKLDNETGWLRHCAMNKDDLKEVLEISDRSLHSFLKNCFDGGYIRQGSKGDFYLSPVYVMNGSWVTVELYLIFRDVKEFNESLTDKEKAIIYTYLGIEDLK